MRVSEYHLEPFCALADSCLLNSHQRRTCNFHRNELAAFCACRSPINGLDFGFAALSDLRGLLSLPVTIFTRGYRRCTIIVEAFNAVAKVWVAVEASIMADAIVFLAVILLAIAAFANFLSHHGLSLFTCLYSCFWFIILASRALTDTWHTCQTLLEAHAVELTTLTSLTVASLNLINIGKNLLTNDFLCLTYQRHGQIDSFIGLLFTDQRLLIFLLRRFFSWLFNLFGKLIFLWGYVRNTLGNCMRTLAGHDGCIALASKIILHNSHWAAVFESLVGWRLRLVFGRFLLLRNDHWLAILLLYKLDIIQLWTLNPFSCLSLLLDPLGHAAPLNQLCLSHICGHHYFCVRIIKR